MPSFISDLAVIDSDAIIGADVSIWHFSHIRSGAFIGAGTSIGKSVYVGPRVQIGKNCKIQNAVEIYEPSEVSDFVFLGPGVILTNDRTPRATLPSGELKNASDWLPVGVKILKGASIGANATCIAPLTIGKWAMVGSGSVVTRDIPDFALVVGNPAKQIGWVGELGTKLVETAQGFFQCPVSLNRYCLKDGKMVSISNE